MPEVDFMVLCDYVRSEAGVLHMIAAGIDRIRTTSVPSGRNVGIGLRVALTRAECESRHEIEMTLTADDQALLSFKGEFGAVFPADQPGGMAFVAFPINMGVPLPSYGTYMLELRIDGVSKKTMWFVVEQATLPVIGGGDAAQAD